MLVLTLDRVVYEGKAKSLILPGERGVFEVLAYHKNLLTRLISGHMILDGSGFPIKRGVAKVEKNKVMVIIEEVR